MEYCKEANSFFEDLGVLVVSSVNVAKAKRVRLQEVKKRTGELRTMLE